MELFTATGKLKSPPPQTRDVRCVHHGWHGIQVLVTHASTWVHRYSSLLQWSVPLGQRGHVAMVGRIPGLWHIPKEKKSQGVMWGDLAGHNISGWSFPDARPVQRPGNTVFRYWRTSQWKWAGLPSCWNTNVGMLQHVQICHVSNGFFRKEWTVHFLTGDCTKHIGFGVTLMLHIGMWVFRSPYSDIAMIYCAADVECCFVTELHPFQEMINGTH